MRYGRFNEEGVLEIINTVSEISNDKLLKKGLLKVVRVEVDLPIGEQIKNNEYILKEGYVEEQIFRYTPTLIERKKALIERLKNIFNTIMIQKYPDYEQRLGALGLLPSNYVNNMKSVLSNYLSSYNNYVSSINNCSTLEAINIIESDVDEWINKSNGSSPA